MPRVRHLSARQHLAALHSDPRVKTRDYVYEGGVYPPAGVSFEEEDAALEEWVNPAETLVSYETYMLVRDRRTLSRVSMRGVHWLLVNGMIPRGDERRWDKLFWTQWDAYYFGTEPDYNTEDTEPEDEESLTEEEKVKKAKRNGPPTPMKPPPTPYAGRAPTWGGDPQNFADVFAFGAQDKYFSAYGGRMRVMYNLFWRKKLITHAPRPGARSFDSDISRSDAESSSAHSEAENGIRVTAPYNPSHCDTSEHDARVGPPGSVVAYDVMSDHPIYRSVMTREGIQPPPMSAILPAARPPPGAPLSSLPREPSCARQGSAGPGVDPAASRGEKRKAVGPPSAPHPRSPLDSEEGKGESKKQRT